MNNFDLCLEVVSRSRQPLRMTLNISETVRDRDYGSKRLPIGKWHMGYRMVTWPMTSRDLETSTFDPIRLERNISITAGDRDFKFGMQLIVSGMPSGRTNNFHRKWAWPKSRDAYNFWHTIEHISKTTCARDFKFGKRLWLSGSAYYGILKGSIRSAILATACLLVTCATLC